MTDPTPAPRADLPAWRLILSAPVIVAALGYFVDIYDLILFSVVRKPSLEALGITGDDLTTIGVRLLNLQMIGMFIGGVFWGVLGDRRGRVSILFGSIIMYSLANLLNAGVGMSEMVNGVISPILQYEILRVLAGIGLAGELGAGITLVAESLPARLRGLGTMVVASVGVAGATLAFVIAEHYGWRTSYLIGGIMGIALLILRFIAHESGMFSHIKEGAVRRGDFLSLFTGWSRLKRYLVCIGIGMPTWFVVGIFITLTPEMGVALGVTDKLNAGRAVFWCYLGLIFGDLASGLLSQLLRSRRLAVAIFLVLTGVVSGVYLSMRGHSPDTYYWLCFALGVSVGYWALFVTVAAEQFGTNLRATVATTVPNFARGAVVPITTAYVACREGLGTVGSAAMVGTVCLAIALVSVWAMRETFSSDLDYTE